MKEAKIVGLNRALQKTVSFIMDNNVNGLESDSDKVKKLIDLLAELQIEVSDYSKHLIYYLVHGTDPAFQIKQETLESREFSAMVRESNALYPQDAPKPADMLRLNRNRDD